MPDALLNNDARSAEGNSGADAAAAAAATDDDGDGCSSSGKVRTL